MDRLSSPSLRGTQREQAKKFTTTVRTCTKRKLANKSKVNKRSPSCLTILTRRKEFLLLLHLERLDARIPVGSHRLHVKSNTATCQGHLFRSDASWHCLRESAAAWRFHSAVFSWSTYSRRRNRLGA